MKQNSGLVMKSNIYLEKILIIKTHLVALHIILSFLFLSKPSDNILPVTTPKEFYMYSQTCP
jgi:hypothetical protein